MSERLEQARKAFDSALKHVRYDEGVVIGSYVGLLEKCVEELEEKLTKRYGQGYRQGKFEERLEGYHEAILPLQVDNQRYKQALERYADIDNYVGEIQWIAVDQGDLARKKLEESKNESK